MDVIACHDAAQAGADHVRTNGGPFFLEFRTYRFRAHSMFDPELYRDKTEVEEWRKRDPIHAFAEQCLKDGTLTADEITAIEHAADAEVRGSSRVRRGRNMGGRRRPRARCADTGSDCTGRMMKTTYREPRSTTPCAMPCATIHASS